MVNTGDELEEKKYAMSFDITEIIEKQYKGYIEEIQR